MVFRRLTAEDRDHKVDYSTISWRMNYIRQVDKTEKIRSRLK